jgi:pilus assembly protein CpaB
MNRRTRLLIVIALSVVIAAVASTGVFYAMRRVAPRVEKEPQVPVVVATEAIAMGTLLTVDHVKVAYWPASTPVQGAYAEPAKVLNRGLLASVVENEPLTDAKLAPPESGGGLPPQIKENYRAISVKVNEVIGVAGFVVPGSRVDVIVTIREQNDSRTRVVVSNVQVLTAGTAIDQDKAKDGKPVPSTVVTLMVTPDDAERIALASAEGQLMLTLRNPLDGTPTATSGITKTKLVDTQSHNLPVPRPGDPEADTVAKPAPRTVRSRPAVPVQPVHKVDTIKAGKRVQEIIQ